MRSDGEASDDVYVPDGNLLDEMTIFSEDLHARTLVATVTDYIATIVPQYGHLPRVPELTFLASCGYELTSERDVKNNSSDNLHQRAMADLVCRIDV